MNLPELDRAYLAVQKEVHPDRHVRGSDSEQRLAMQMTTLANTAYQTLKNPIQRGLYLCKLHGIDAQLETNTAMPAAFLLQQIAWRESLEEHEDDLAALAALSEEVHLSYQTTLTQLTIAIDQSANYAQAAELIRGLLFIDKFVVELDDATANLT